MAVKKKTSTTKKNANYRFSFEIIGLIFIILSIFSASKTGFAGVFSANLFRFFVGNTFIVASILVGIYGVYLVFKGKEPPFKNKRIMGFLLIYSSLLLVLHARLFAPIVHSDIDRKSVV